MDLGPRRYLAQIRVIGSKKFLIFFKITKKTETFSKNQLFILVFFIYNMTKLP